MNTFPLSVLRFSHFFKWLEDLLKYRVLIFLQKIIANKEPFYLFNKLCFLTSTRYTYSTDPSGNSITFDRDARSINDIPRLKRQSKQIFTMEQYTPRKRSEIVEIYIQQNKSIVKTQRAFKKLKNVKSAPSKNTIKR